MDKLVIKYHAYDKAIAPRPIRMKVPGWSGAADKMVDGFEPQPWHCLPLVEGSTYGLELLYPYETPCHVVNDRGLVRFDWDYAREPGGQVTGGEFVTFYPKEASGFYLFNTGLDLQPPPNHDIRTAPHPRFFTDDTGTVPLSMIGHVQSDWWPKRFFVVFRAPAPGRRHIFRKGEAYAQILLVPRGMSYELEQMTAEEEANRRKLEQDIFVSKAEIADNVWRNPAGYAFNNHYKILAGAFAREGMTGVEQVVAEGLRRQQQTVPVDKSVAELLELGLQRIKEHNYADARSVYLEVLNREPQNAEALSRLGIIAGCTGVPLLAIQLLSQAVALQPSSSSYHSNLGEMLRLLGRFQEAEASFQAALRLNPNDPLLLSTLALTLAQQGRAVEGMQLCQTAAAMAPQAAPVQYRMGLILALQGRQQQARSCYERALALDPTFTEAKRALEETAKAAR